MITPEIRARVNWSAARYYLKASACFLLLALVASVMLRFETSVWLQLTPNVFGPFVWAIVFLFFAPEFTSHLFPVSKTETQSVYDFDSSQPRHLGEIVRTLCKKRKLRLPTIWIEEREHLFGFNAGAAHDSVLYRNVIFLSRFMLETLPSNLLNALLAHELRHVDTSINMWGRAIRIIGRVCEMMFFAFGVSIAMLSLVTGQFALFALHLPLWYGALILYAVLHRFLDGVCARAVEHHADILAAADIEDHHSLIFLLRSLDQFGLFQRRLFEANMKAQQRFEEKLGALFGNEQSTQTENGDLQPPNAGNRSIASRVYHACRFLLRALFKLPGLLFALLLFGIHLSWRRFPTHPSTDNRVAVLEAIYGPSDPFEPPELPDFDDLDPDAGVIVVVG